MSKIIEGKFAVFLFVFDLILKYNAFHGNYAVINYRISAGLSVNDLLFWLTAFALCAWLYQEKQWLLLCGGVANILSRLIWGGVVDYWNFFGLFYNNLADYMIVGGAILFVISSVVERSLHSGRDDNSRI